LSYRPLSPRTQGAHLLAIGAIGGLAFWTNWLALPYFVVASLYLLLWDWRLMRRPAAWFATGAFFVGSLPFWAYNLKNGFATFHLLGREAALSGSAGRGADLYWVLTRGLPALLGVRDFDGAFAQGVVGLTFAAAVAVGTIVALMRLRGSWLALASGHVERAKPAACLFVLALITTVVYTECARQRFGSIAIWPTATLPLSATAIDWLLERRRAVGASVLALLLVLYASGGIDLHRQFVETPRRFFAGRVDELSKYLMHSAIRFAYADYGDAMITTFLGRDRVVVTDYQNRRYPIEEGKVEDPAFSTMSLTAARRGRCVGWIRSSGRRGWRGIGSTGRSTTTACIARHWRAMAGRSRPPRIPKMRT
jgi:hypothetical protein